MPVELIEVEIAQFVVADLVRKHVSLLKNQSNVKS